MDNTSGQGKASVVPPEIDRWNWGAFFLNWIWGIGNDTLIALLALVPLVNIVVLFVLGAKGSSWAWRNKKWESIEHFKRIQRQWAIWGSVVWAAVVALAVVVVFIAITAMKHSEAYQLGVAKLHADAEAVSLLGNPISAGLPTGSIEESGSDGKARLSFSVAGSKGKGTIYLNASKNLGGWQVDQEELELEGRSDRINLNQ
jgi:hypothetical protein